MPGRENANQVSEEGSVGQKTLRVSRFHERANVCARPVIGCPNKLI